METKEQKAYIEFQKIDRCIKSCTNYRQLRNAEGMAVRFSDHNKKTLPEFVEALYPLLKNSVFCKRISI
jgi:hypothetical protein